MFIGLIQAFIFALLTILYFGMAGETHDEDDHSEIQPQTSDDAAQSTTSTTQSQLQEHAEPHGGSVHHPQLNPQ